MQVSLAIILPEHIKEVSDTKVVYMLHGKGGNYSDWSRFTGIENYASKYNVAIVMPEVHRSYYMNMINGLSFFDYITEELPQVCAHLFKLSEKKEDNYIMGLSMGGYGALKCALKKPEQYKGCAAFSPAVKIKRIAGAVGSLSLEERRGVFGENFYVSEEDDLFYLVRKLKGLAMEEKPDLFLTCGKSDNLYGDLKELRNVLVEEKIDFKYREWEGAHEWTFWDESVKCALNHFFDCV